MKKFCLSVFILLGVFVLSLPAFAQETIEPEFTLLTPTVGQQLQAGSRVAITWNLLIDQAILENPWGELELYLVDERGPLLRITPQLNITARSFDWLVPAINTQSARIVLQFGVEGEGELAYLSQTGTFSIKAKKAAAIDIDLPARASAGNDLDIRWNSNLDRSYAYDVMISYDRGAHFFKAGTTSDLRFAFPVDADFSGAITVQIVARGTDGSRISSLLSRNATILVKD